jgi:hypothetical protein
VLVNLYMPSFLAGCFWTTFCSEMAFAGTRTSRGILFDSRRALPTFLVVTAVGALYSSPESRLSVVTYIAVQTLGNIKELTNSINTLNLRITEVIGEGRVTSTTLLNHDRRITGLEQWRVTLPPVRREAP